MGKALLGGALTGLIDEQLCPVVSMGCAMLPFIVSTSVIAVMVRLFTRMSESVLQNTEIIMSNNMILKQRDGTCILQTRFISSNGRDLLDVCVTMSSYLIRLIIYTLT